MNIFKLKPISIPALLAGAIYVAPDNDSFSYVVATSKGLNSLAMLSLYNYPQVVLQLYMLGVIGLGCALGVIGFSGRETRRYPFVIASVLVCILIAFAAAHFVIDEKSLVSAVLGTPMRPWYLFLALPFAAFDSYVRTVHLLPFLLGFMVVLSLKSACVVLVYLAGGGVSFFGQIRAMTSDGGFLSNLMIGSMIASAGVIWFRLRKDWNGTLACICVTLLLLLPVVGSFRRSVLLYTLGSIILGYCIFMHMRGQLLRYLPILGFSLGILLSVIALGYVAMFGVAEAKERLGSLTLSAETNQYASSNNYYLDDWVSWSALIKRDGLLGVGFMNDYGISDRLTISGADSAGIEVPLHVGMYELWTRLGVVGALFHVVFFIAIPAYCLFWKRPIENVESQLIASFAISIILVVGLYPFSPPQYMNISLVVPCALAMGLIAAAYPKGTSGYRQRGRRPLTLNHAPIAASRRV